MEKSDPLSERYEELPREEALVRLYQLKAQLDLEDVIALDNLELVGAGFCDDCHAAATLRKYGSVALCERDALSRMAVVRVRLARELGAT